MKYNYLKYNIYLIATVLIVIMSSCAKGDEPIPMSDTVTVDTNDGSMMREGDVTGGGDGGDDASIIGGDNNEDDDDTIVGGDDNEDDDVDVIGGDVIIGGGLTGGSSDGGKGGN